MSTLLSSMPKPEDRESQILCALGDFYGLTIKQVMELYGWNSYPRATEAFRKITYNRKAPRKQAEAEGKEGVIYLRKKEQERDKFIYLLRRGNSKKETIPGDVYFLLRSGAERLRKDGYTPTFSFEINKARLLRPAGIEHTLLVNEVLIKLKLFSDTHQSRFRLQDVDHERIMRSTYEKAFQLYPDGCIRFLFKPENKFKKRCFFLELEHTSAHDKEKWKAKVRGYMDLFQTKLEMYFQTDRTFVLVIVTNPEFVRHLKNWTEETLSEMGTDALAYRNWFCFGSFDQTLSPVQFFCTPRFLNPFNKSPVVPFTGLALSPS